MLLLIVKADGTHSYHLALQSCLILSRPSQFISHYYITNHQWDLICNRPLHRQRSLDACVKIHGINLAWQRYTVDLYRKHLLEYTRSIQKTNNSQPLETAPWILFTSSVHFTLLSQQTVTEMFSWNTLSFLVFWESKGPPSTRLLYKNDAYCSTLVFEYDPHVQSPPNTLDLVNNCLLLLSTTCQIKHTGWHKKKTF
jgi:hypothetical protein